MRLAVALADPCINEHALGVVEAPMLDQRVDQRSDGAAKPEVVAVELGRLECIARVGLGLGERTDAVSAVRARGGH